MQRSLIQPTVRLDVSETADAYHVMAELGGMNKEDVRVNMSDGVLTVEGEKEKETVKDTETMHMEERRFGKFQRSIRLPENADEKGSSAEFKDGMLRLTIKKIPKAEHKKKEILIR
eukprot:222930_1